MEMDQAQSHKADVVELIERYVTYLDTRDFSRWLDLFSDDCYYVMILREDFLKNNNLVAIGEDKRRLQCRIEVAVDVEPLPTIHLVSAIMLDEASDAGATASANFVVYRDISVTCTGRYHFEIVRHAGSMKIRNCRVVLNNSMIHGTIYLPV